MSRTFEDQSSPLRLYSISADETNFDITFVFSEIKLHLRTFQNVLAYSGSCHASDAGIGSSHASATLATHWMPLSRLSQ